MPLAISLARMGEFDSLLAPTQSGMRTQGYFFMGFAMMRKLVCKVTGLVRDTATHLQAERAASKIKALRGNRPHPMCHTLRLLGKG
jgi:hypothetical protein